ncbi:hypothetical protein GCM10009841_08340 [Microlunatus panaciterrae]|uniref:Uncharacterized protein n=1 Tax=Microlunatus panaciterrae TaxID=400768 RepID=A0ABS2RK43_9ACTN|nr:hypothetical protein [Microlunatus panaciterrae]MBM7799379.1 hypothetical protein [Microlunatus panaciterrae]
MDRWHHAGGLPWLYRPALGEGTVAAVVLGRGYAHQQVDQLGSLDAAAEVVRLTLSRPMERSAGGVREAAVRVDVGLYETTVQLRGEPETVRSGLLRLDTMLRDPVLLGLEHEQASRLDHPFAGWGSELAVWFGAGPAALSTEFRPRLRPSEEVVTEALRSLHPTRSRSRWSGCGHRKSSRPSAVHSLSRGRRYTAARS